MLNEVKAQDIKDYTALMDLAKYLGLEIIPGGQQIIIRLKRMPEGEFLTMVSNLLEAALFLRGYDACHLYHVRYPAKKAKKKS